MANDDQKFTHRILITAMLMAAIAAAVFLNYPQIDIYAEHLFYDKTTGFVLNNIQAVHILRKTAIFAYAVWYVAISVLLIVSIIAIQKARPLVSKFNLKQLLFLVTTSLAGPLFIANIILKNNWGRARPRQILEFGGTQEFSPPILISDQCVTNCSFVSGEPSSMFMIFISLAFVMPAKRALMLFAALIFGALSGIMRMGQGGHFLSDVIFAGLFMTVIAGAIYWVIFLSPLASKIKSQ